MRKTIAALALAATVVGVAAQPAAAKSQVPGKPGAETIYAIAADNDNFDTLQSLLELTGLDEAVNQTDMKLTVFAPTDAAFAKLPAEVVADLLAEPGYGTLKEILLYHVTDGRRFSNSVFGKNEKMIEMLNGGVVVSNPDVTLTDGADQTVTVVAPFNVNASNGVIHAIDTVLLPG